MPMTPAVCALLSGPTAASVTIQPASTVLLPSNSMGPTASPVVRFGPTAANATLPPVSTVLPPMNSTPLSFPAPAFSVKLLGLVADPAPHLDVQTAPSLQSLIIQSASYVGMSGPTALNVTIRPALTALFPLNSTEPSASSVGMHGAIASIAITQPVSTVLLPSNSMELYVSYVMRPGLAAVSVPVEVAPIALTLTNSTEPSAMAIAP